MARNPSNGKSIEPNGDSTFKDGGIPWGFNGLMCWDNSDGLEIMGTHGDLTKKGGGRMVF